LIHKNSHLIKEFKINYYFILKIIYFYSNKIQNNKLVDIKT